ncbi:MAG: hypothetical protein GF335_01405, partial [Candidatus Moranbacteria bacterium]|nr:hypothetical protein [Candidatus Moranbacteria bacterium]
MQKQENKFISFKKQKNKKFLLLFLLFIFALTFIFKFLGPSPVQSQTGLKGVATAELYGLFLSKINNYAKAQEQIQLLKPCIQEGDPVYEASLVGCCQGQTALKPNLKQDSQTEECVPIQNPIQCYDSAICWDLAISILTQGLSIKGICTQGWGDNCGNGQCQSDLGEDKCNCPEDCQEQDGPDFEILDAFIMNKDQSLPTPLGESAGEGEPFDAKIIVNNKGEEIQDVPEYYEVVLSYNNKEYVFNKEDLLFEFDSQEFTIENVSLNGQTKILLRSSKLGEDMVINQTGSVEMKFELRLPEPADSNQSNNVFTKSMVIGDGPDLIIPDISLETIDNIEFPLSQGDRFNAKIKVYNRGSEDFTGDYQIEVRYEDGG